MLNFIFDYFLDNVDINIKDLMRISGVVLGMFQEFININDNNITQLLSFFVYAVYLLA